MKKLTLAILAGLFIIQAVQAQVGVHGIMNTTGKPYKAAEIERFRNSETFLVARQVDPQALQKIASEVWTFSKITVVPAEEYDRNIETYAKNGSFVIDVNGLRIDRTTKSGMNVEYLYVTYDYFYFSDYKMTKKGKAKYDKNLIISFYLSGSTDAMWKMIGTTGFCNLYDDLDNYSLGYIRNYLQLFNSMLTANRYNGYDDRVVDENEITKLRTATLYVPSHVERQSRLGWSDKEVEAEDLFAKYGYPYKVVDKSEIHRKILESDDFYYFYYVRVNGHKHLMVMNGKTGKIVYKILASTFSYQLKQKDITEMAQAIKKGK